MWFNLRINRDVKVGFGFATRLRYKQMCAIIGGQQFGEGIITQTTETQWTIRVIAPQRQENTGKQVSIVMNKYPHQPIPPGLSWY